MAASDASSSTATEPPAKHAPLCDCGSCGQPDVVSLFEQARIRKAKKEKDAPPVEQAELCEDESSDDDDVVIAAALLARRRRAESDAPKQVEQR
jgi:hypothetical protein